MTQGELLYQPPEHPQHNPQAGHGYPPPPPQVGGYGPQQQWSPNQPYAQTGTQPSAYLAYNIIGIFGCMSVLGIIGLVFSLQVNSRWSYGDVAGAEQASRTARILGIISLIGTILMGLFVILYIIAIVYAVTTTGPTGTSNI